jgi:hypothetical protein
MFRLWEFNKRRLVRAFRRRGWQVKYCKNGALAVTTLKDIYFFGHDSTPDNLLRFAWSSLSDSRTRFTFEKTLRAFLCLFDELQTYKKIKKN